MKILVIVPAFNEAPIIEKTVLDIQRNVKGADILVINDGSTDETLAVLRRSGTDHLNLCCNLGIGGAVQSGYLYAFENGYDYAVQIDGDGQHDPSYVLPIIEQMERDGADIGIGSRFLEKEGFQSSPMRRFGILYLSGLIRLVSGVHVMDVTSGFRVANRRMIELFAADYPDDYPEPESIVAAKYAGAAIAEYPVKMRERTTGVSSIGAGKSVLYMIKESLAIVLYPLLRRKRSRR